MIMDGKQIENESRNVESSEDKRNPLISVIVPVYNVRAYIAECVESLIHQTYTNLEIILVDDGSADGSEKVCDEYMRKDSRVRVIHQENRGLSGARNTGLDNANGRYVAFVDSDDLVLPDYMEILYGLIKKYSADIAACAYMKGTTRELQDYKGRAMRKDSAIEVCMTSEEMLRQWHGRYRQQETVAWNKLYIRDVWNGKNIKRFPEGRRHEDVLTSHLIVQSVKKVVLTPQCLYLYRVREGSIVVQAADSKEGIRQNLCAQKERMEFFRKQGYWRAYCNLMAGYLLHVGWFGWKRIGSHVLRDDKKSDT